MNEPRRSGVGIQRSRAQPTVVRGCPVQMLSRVLFALGLILQGVWYSASSMWAADTQDKTALLGAIGYVIIAIAVFDVAKFLVEEEVLNRREKQTASDARRSLTKFTSTI